jgi:hypothetical protein
MLRGTFFYDILYLLSFVNIYFLLTHLQKKEQGFSYVALGHFFPLKEDYFQMTQQF